MYKNGSGILICRSRLHIYNCCIPEISESIIIE